MPQSPSMSRQQKKHPQAGLSFWRKPAVSTHPQLSVFGTEGKWRIFRKSRNIFGRTSFSIIIVCEGDKIGSGTEMKCSEWICLNPFMFTEKYMCVWAPAGKAPGPASSAPGLWEPSFWHALRGFQAAWCSSLAVKKKKNSQHIFVI